MTATASLSGVSAPVNRPAFVRYARARVRYVHIRLLMASVGCLTIGLLAGPYAAIVAAIVAILGEVVDTGYLAWVARSSDGQGLPKFHMGISGITAALHALSVSFCVMVSVSTAPDPNVSFFALAFLVGASMDAGLSMSLNSLATNLRLSIFAATTLFSLVVQRTFENGGSTGVFLNLIGIGILGSVIYTIVITTRASARRQSRSRADLLARTVALEQAHHDLSKLQEETRKLALVAQHANDIVVIQDGAQHIVWVNEAFTRVTGYTLDEVMGHSPADVLSGPDTDMQEMERVDAALREGQAMRSVMLNYTKDAQELWLDTNLVPIQRDGKVDMIIGIERDITQARAQAKALEQARENAEASARAKAAFLAMVSHEIRTPMNGILGMAEVLNSTQLNAAQRNYLATMHASAEALLAIIDDVLDVSKLNAGKLTVENAPFCFATCVRNSADLLRQAATDKGLFFDVVFDTKLPTALMGDQGRIRQILVNLMGNAVKFTKSGGVTVQVSHSLQGADALVTVQVRDTGIGVPKHRRDRIFEMFEQADTTTNRNFGGTGLGLAISRQLAQKMSGDVVLVSGKGPGACFEVSLCLPLAEEDVTAQHTGETADRAAKGEAVLKELKLLVAEDNATNQLLIKTFLADEKIALRMVSNGVEALEEVMREPPDVILMDMSMPEMNGLDATRAIRATLTRQPVIIALTANAFEADKQACLDAGMNAFLSKPVRRNDLIFALSRVAQGHYGQNSLGPPEINGLSHSGARNEVASWISPPGSGTTNGRSTLLSDP